MFRFNFITAVPVWSLVYYVFLFFHVYGNIFFVLYSSVWGFLSFKQQRTFYVFDFLFLLSFFKYALW